MEKETYPPKYTIRVCRGARCSEFGSGDVLKAFIEKLSLQEGQTEIGNLVRLETVYCMSSCPTGANVTVNSDFYEDMSPAKVEEILHRYLEKEKDFLATWIHCPLCQKSFFII